MLFRFFAAVQPRLRRSVQLLSQHQFSRTIRKVAPSVLSRCFAANFAHKPALSPCISTSTKMCKHILCCLCLCMAELLQNDYILKRFCLQSHILIIDLVIFNQYNREGKRRRIEAVITGRTRNALALRGTRVRIPPSPLLFIHLLYTTFKINSQHISLFQCNLKGNRTICHIRGSDM